MKILADTLLLFTRSTVQRVIQIPVFLVTAKVLGPEGLGLLRLLGLVPTLAKFASVDFVSVTIREVADVVDEHGRIRQTKARNVAYTVNLLWGALLALGVLAYSVTVDQAELAWGLRLGAVSLILVTIGRLMQANCVLVKDFRLIAQWGMIEALANAAFTLATIWWLGVLAPLIAAVAAGVLQIVWLGRRMGLQARFAVDAAEVMRQGRIALPLALGTMAYGAQTWVERGLVGGLWGLTELGYFSFLTTMVVTVTVLFANVMQAGGVHVYHLLGKSGGRVETEALIDHPTLAMACVAPVLAAVAVFWSGPLIQSWLPDYAATIPLLPWMGAVLWLTPATGFYSTALNSARLNAQTLNLGLSLAQLAIFAGGCWIGAALGWGLAGALAARVASLASTNAATIFLAVRGLHGDARLGWRRILECHLPGLWSAAVVHVVLLFADGDPARLLAAPLAFAVAYAPVVAYLEHRTAYLRQYVWPLLGRFRAKR